MSSPVRPNVRMRAVFSSLPEERALPAGYVLREANEDEVDELARLLSAAFDGDWTTQSVRDVLLSEPSVLKVFVIAHRERLVATASYQLRPLELLDGGWVHWVASDPDHRGLGLGYVVSRRVLEECLIAGFREAYLETQDHRLPAIRTYLRLGFLPDPWHESHQERWDNIFAELKGSVKS